MQQSITKLFSLQKTWQRLEHTGILLDAFPHPSDRDGFPMHVKVWNSVMKSSFGVHNARHANVVIFISEKLIICYC